VSRQTRSFSLGRAERAVDRVGAILVSSGRRGANAITKAASRGREEADDIWAEARRVRRSWRGSRR
jgi:hypothetical protein